MAIEPKFTPLAMLTVAGCSSAPFWLVAAIALRIFCLLLMFPNTGDGRHGCLRRLPVSEDGLPTTKIAQTGPAALRLSLLRA